MKHLNSQDVLGLPQQSGDFRRKTLEGGSRAQFEVVAGSHQPRYPQMAAAAQHREAPASWRAAGGRILGLAWELGSLACTGNGMGMLEKTCQMCDF